MIPGIRCVSIQAGGKCDCYKLRSITSHQSLAFSIQSRQCKTKRFRIEFNSKFYCLRSSEPSYISCLILEALMILIGIRYWVTKRRTFLDQKTFISCKTLKHPYFKTLLTTEAFKLNAVISYLFYFETKNKIK